MNPSISPNEMEKPKRPASGFLLHRRSKAYLKEGLARTPGERFLYLMKLIKLQRVMQSGTWEKGVGDGINPSTE